MNDPRIEDFLVRVRKDLGEFFPVAAADERLREIRSHLEEAIARAEAAGEADPTAAALADFGNADGYRRAATEAGGGILNRHPERVALKWAAATLLVPIVADLAMDFSSWFTGSDSALYGIGIPVTLYLGVRFGIASTHVRRFLAAPLMALVLGSFVAFTVVGGWARATDTDGLLGSRTRGTAFRRREGLIKDSLPAKVALANEFNRMAAAFVADRPTMGVGEFRTAAGYLTPTIPQSERDVWKGDPRAGRWLIDGVRYVPVADYAEAHRRWQEEGPAMLRLAKSGVQGEREEIDQLARVVDCPWSTSVRAQLDAKLAMGLFFGFWLLVVHALGVAGGAIGRKRRGRMVA